MCTIVCINTGLRFDICIRSINIRMITIARVPFVLQDYNTCQFS